MSISLQISAFGATVKAPAFPHPVSYIGVLYHETCTDRPGSDRDVTPLTPSGPRRSAKRSHPLVARTTGRAAMKRAPANRGPVDSYLVTPIYHSTRKPKLRSFTWPIAMSVLIPMLNVNCVAIWSSMFASIQPTSNSVLNFSK